MEFWFGLGLGFLAGVFACAAFNHWLLMRDWGDDKDSIEERIKNKL
jgi:hypothetical protein